MKADFYETLGVTKTVDDKELKAAFRKQARKSRKSTKPTRC